MTDALKNSRIPWRLVYFVIYAITFWAYVYLCSRLHRWLDQLALFLLFFFAMSSFAPPIDLIKSRWDKIVANYWGK